MPWRFSIGRLMALTGVVAVNLAVVTASTRVLDLIIAVYLCGPILVGVQLALYRSVFGRPACRPFWLGFAASGTVAGTALYWAYFSPLHMAFLRAYTSFWGGIDRVAPDLERVLSSHDWSIDAVFALYYFVPQVLVAFAGGALVDRLARAGGRSGRDRLPGTAA